MSERYDDVIGEYIDFVNKQVGTYMDALPGFVGHYAKVHRQVHRISRQSAKRQEDGETVAVYASYEDPSKPDVIHNRSVRAHNYLKANSAGGSNEQWHALAIAVFYLHTGKMKYGLALPPQKASRQMKLNRT